MARRRTGGLTLGARYSIFFAPADASDLADFGYGVLQRTADGRAYESRNKGLSYADKTAWSRLIEKPAHYGFHATIKAPFTLQDGSTENSLLDAVEQFAQRSMPLALNSLHVEKLRHFAALILSDEEHHRVSSLAATVVDGFEKFRAPLSKLDMEKRQPARLTSGQREMLDQYGYPYVKHEFRFHMTLSGQLNDADEQYVQWLHEAFANTVKTTGLLDRLCVFYQPDRRTPLVRISEHVFVKQAQRAFF